MKRIWFVIACVWIGLPAFAQTDLALLRELAAENKNSVEALALYPKDVRMAILEATLHPEILVKMQGLRDKAGEAFRTLIEDFPKPQQSVFYEISRYPGLMANLDRQQAQPKAMQEALLVLIPEQREPALDLVSDNPGLVRKIAALEQTTSAAFERLLAPYPANAQQAFRLLLQSPEVLDILNEDLRFTVLVGDTYREYPTWVIHQMDSLSLAVARTQAAAFDSWRNNLEQDPAAQAELKDAVQAYVSEHETTTDYYSDEIYSEADPTYIIVERPYYQQPYYWWYGYPWWYPYPRWHPYPWWWDCGWHWGPHGVVVVYFPSYHFVHWYFDHPHHHIHYSHLSAHFVDHYHGWRRSGTTIDAAVGEWRDRNKGLISDEWLSDRGKLPARMKEYGQFEVKREAYNAKNPNQRQSATDFLNKNPNKYPELEKSRATVITRPERPEKKAWAPEKEPVKVPSQRETRERPSAVKPPTPPDTGQKPQPTDRRKGETPAAQPNDYHRQKWDEAKKAKPQRQPAPSTRKAPTKSAPNKTKKVGRQ